jgi:hypothetical protein
MEESRVVVATAAGVYGDVRLAVAFDGAPVSFHGSQKEVRVRLGWDPRGLVLVLDAIEAWLKPWMDDRSFRVLRLVLLGSAR